jgi:hypothetical protein
MKNGLIKRTIAALVLTAGLVGCTSLPIKSVPTFQGGVSYTSKDGKEFYFKQDFSDGTIKVGFEKEKDKKSYTLEDKSVYLDVQFRAALDTGRALLSKTGDGRIRIEIFDAPTPVGSQQNLFFETCKYADTDQNGVVTRKESGEAVKDGLSRLTKTPGIDLYPSNGI